MKILMLAPQPFFEPRGTPFSVLGRLKALSALGHEVDLLTYHVGQDVTLPGVTIHRTPKVGFIKSVKIGPSAPKLLLDSLLLAKAIGMLRKYHYDLLHTHEEASFFGIALAKLFKLPHLYDMHSSLTQQLSNFQYSRVAPLVGFFDMMERRVIKSSNAIITICPALHEHVSTINGHVPQVMIENVDTGRDPVSIPEEEAQAFLDSHPQLKGKKIVLYTGTFEAYQGISPLVESTRKVVETQKDVVFVLVGGKPEQVQQTREQIQALGLESYFYLTGNRPPEEIPQFVRLCDVLVSPRTDGTNTPLKIYAYMQSGKPIVATDLYTHTQVLTPELAVLVEANTEGLAQGILKVLEDPLLAASVGARSREFFQANYTMQKYISKTEQVLQAAVPEPVVHVRN